MNDRIVPRLSRALARNQINVDIEQWKHFAQRMTKNPFVKTFILERDGNKCAWCSFKMFEKKIIHHTTYEHHCSHNKVIRIPAPTPCNPHKTRIVPDCEGCRSENNGRFLTCMSKLVLVHNLCNKIIAGRTTEADYSIIEKGIGRIPRH